VKVVIESYLTEAKLAAALQQLVGAAWAGGQVLLPGSRRRFDMPLSLLSLSSSFSFISLAGGSGGGALPWMPRHATASSWCRPAGVSVGSLRNVTETSASFV
jgi:hypothetical protein